MRIVLIPGRSPSDSKYRGQIVTVDRYFIEILEDEEDGSIWINKGLIQTVQMV